MGRLDLTDLLTYNSTLFVVLCWKIRLVITTLLCCCEEGRYQLYLCFVWSHQILAVSGRGNCGWARRLFVLDLDHSNKSDLTDIEYCGSRWRGHPQVALNASWSLACDCEGVKNTKKEASEYFSYHLSVTCYKCTWHPCKTCAVCTSHKILISKRKVFSLVQDLITESPDVSWDWRKQTWQPYIGNVLNFNVGYFTPLGNVSILYAENCEMWRPTSIDCEEEGGLELSNVVISEADYAKPGKIFTFIVLYN